MALAVALPPAYDEDVVEACTSHGDSKASTPTAPHSIRRSECSKTLSASLLPSAAAAAVLEEEEEEEGR